MNGMNDKQPAVTITVDAVMENVREVIMALRGFLERLGCNRKMRKRLELALEEAFVNIVHYAYPGRTGGAKLTISESDGVLTVVIEDSGVPFDPLRRKEPDVTLPAEQRKVGGLGIFILRRNTDSLSYKYENGRNILTMKKNLRADEPGVPDEQRDGDGK